jgi:hypothetical protein
VETFLDLLHQFEPLIPSGLLSTETVTFRNGIKSAKVNLMVTKDQGRHPHIRVLGADCTGKTAVCNTVSALMPDFVEFSSTEPYVYSWLKTYGVGPSSTITPNQVEIRRQVFLAANRAQMRAVKEVTEKRPLIAVRGRADTIITHDVLQGKALSHSMTRLFPEPYMSPDALVVLTAPITAIAERLDARGQAKTGANSLEFHRLCQERYIEIGNLAGFHVPVFIFDTGDPKNTPEYIADYILGKVAI